ncbi:hypothetical protein NADE_006671 [Nannochloris sp. 'desiccata']|nr:hypothetical protein KSW81_005382 [Chlorella desiccata (nom. nud.)]KAH7621408.1 hypothetical protein NADE_006671 [Chlorella desiccata (nom. nud.)]
MEFAVHFNQPKPDELAVPASTKRFALIVAPAGPSSRHQEWLDSARLNAGRNWDLALIYYGPDGDKFNCKECVAVTVASCAKWRCLSGFLNSTLWNDDLYHRYEAVMVADDDLGMKAGSLNMFFKIFRDYRLILAQPSVCPNSYSFWLQVVGQRPSSMMRFSNFVELMAPTFTSYYLDTTVRKTVGEAYTGWGLDFVWPFLLNFPRNKVAIVDGACVQHARPTEGDGRQRVYFANMPRNAYQEKDYLLEKFNYNEKSLAEFNMSVWQPVTFGMLPLGAKPINPPPELEPVEEYSAYVSLSRAFRLHIGGLEGGGAAAAVASLIQKIGVGLAGFFLIAIVLSLFKKMGRWRRRRRA